MDIKPVYRVGAAGLDPRDWRLIEIVFKHSQYNRYEFQLVQDVAPSSIDILIVNTGDPAGLKAVTQIRAEGRAVPIIAAVPRGSPSSSRHAISIDRLTLQLLPILNRVVELELHVTPSRAARVPQATPVPPAPDPAPVPTVPTVAPVAASGAPAMAPAPRPAVDRTPERAPVTQLPERPAVPTHGATVTRIHPARVAGDIVEQSRPAAPLPQTAREARPLGAPASAPLAAGLASAALDAGATEAFAARQRSPWRDVTPVTSLRQAAPAEMPAADLHPARPSSLPDGGLAARSNLVAFPAPDAAAPPAAQPPATAAQQPVVSASRVPAPDDSPPAGVKSPAHRLSVLVVDDSPTVRKQLGIAFERMGMRCVAVSSAAQALAALAEDHFDLAFVDVVMPDMDGYKLTREIRRERKRRQLPVIILTSRSSPFDLARGALAGCDSYLTKPVPLKALEGAVVKQLRKSLAIDDLSGLIRPLQMAPAPSADDRLRPESP